MNRARISAVLLVVTVTSVAVAASQNPPPVDLAAAAQATIDGLGRNEYAAVHATFSDKLRTAMPEKKLRSTWEGVLKKQGKLQFTGTPVPRTVRNLRSIAIPTQFEKGKLEIEVVFNQANEVTGLLMKKIK